MKRLSTILTIASVAVVASCVQKRPAARPSPAVAIYDEPPATIKTQQKATPPPDKSQIVIEESIRDACGITDAEAFFEYDSSRVSSAGEVVLKRLSDCFITGHLRGKAMDLVGHADPRGSGEYNMALGGRRAESVKNALITFGLSASVITTSSRGEMEATGVDSLSWPHDRRVDVTISK